MHADVSGECDLIMSGPSINFHVQTNVTQFRVPSELIKKHFKNTQKLIEKQKKQLQSDVQKIKSSEALPNSMKLVMIRKIIKNFEEFQAKLQHAIQRDESYRSRLVARLDNLLELSHYVVEREPAHEADETLNEADEAHDASAKEASAEKSDVHDEQLDLHNPKLISWYRDQTNLMIIDYLIKSNTREANNVGLKLLKNLSQANPQFRKLVDYDLYTNFNKVFMAIVKDHDLSLITAWFEENKTSLKKVNSNLEFEINYCRFLSFIKQGKVQEAIKFSRIHLSPGGNQNNYSSGEMENYLKNLTVLKQLGGFLVFIAITEDLNPAETQASFSSEVVKKSQRFHNFERLLDDERWVTLSKCFIKDFTKLYGISKNYPLFIYLSAGLSSLKTKSCYCNVQNTVFVCEDEYPIPANPNYTDKHYRGPNYYYKLLNKINHCPVCSPELFKLSRNLPYAQLITSVFNNPYRLPNGNIYPFDKLTTPSERYNTEKNELLRMNKIKDPLTKEIFNIEECARIYPA